MVAGHERVVRMSVRLATAAERQCGLFMCRQHPCQEAPFWRSWRKGLSSLGIFLLLSPVTLALAGLAHFAPPTAGDFLDMLGDPYVWHVVRFTFLQAFLSASLSLVGGLLLARSLFRRGPFLGAKWLRRLMLLPMVLPQIVVVLGFLAVWGRQGWLWHVLSLIGFDERASIYGLSGILMAHAFYNVPLAARLFLSRLESVPGEYWRLAAQLGMARLRVFTLVEWPAIRTIFPGVALLIFMLCATSFTVVLVLGGGPSATTLEVAIYQALRFDFIPERAMVLSLLQMLLMLVVHMILRRLDVKGEGTETFRRHVRHPFADERGALICDMGLIILACIYLVLPLVAVIVDGAKSASWRILDGRAVLDAILTSLGVSAAAAILALIIVFLMLAYIHHPRGIVPDGTWMRICDAVASLVLVIPVVTLAAGGFLLLLSLGLAEAAAPFVVIVLNAIMVLPFVWRILSPVLQTVQERNGRLIAQLGLRWLDRMRLVDWPLMRGAIGLALALAMALSIGDLGSIALFGSESFHTLPWLIYQELGSYRAGAAAGLSSLLLIMVGALLGVAGLFEAPRGSRDAGPALPAGL